MRTFDNPLKFWTPGDMFPTLPRKDITIPKLAQVVKNDMDLADRLFFPYSNQMFEYAPFQRVTAKAIKDHKFIFMQAIRGAAKSYTIARTLLLMMLLEKLTVILTAPTYRQALIPFGYMLSLIRENSAPGYPLSIENEIDGNITQGTMESRFRLKNGSLCKVLPMADGSRLRGERADILWNDEAFKLEREMYSSHIVPFLQKPVIPGRPESKLILSTSAESQDCFVYGLLLKWLKNIQDETALVVADPRYKRKYCVLDWNFDDVTASGMKMEEDITKEIENIENNDPEEVARIRYNRWKSMSGSFFPGNLTERLRSTSVHIETSRPKGDTAAYGLAIDVASSKIGDYFVIHTLKHLEDARKTALVNTYWDKGLSNDEMALRIHEFNNLFNPEYIVIDKGGGGTYVVDSLSKRKLIMRDGTEHNIQVPLLLHDEPILNGQKKVFYNVPHDSMVRRALAGERLRGGEDIATVDIFIHLLYNSFRNAMLQEDVPLLIPFSASEDGDPNYDRSEVKILDQILESCHQLKALTYKTKVNLDGSVEKVLSKTNKVPMYVWKSQNKDGATALLYGWLLHLLHFAEARGGNSGYDGPIIEPNPMYSEMNPWAGLWEDTSQIVKPGGI